MCMICKFAYQCHIGLLKSYRYFMIYHDMIPLHLTSAIAYDSKVLSKYESNYDTTRLEASAIIWAVKKFRPYLHERKFKIITDHNALIWLLNSDRSNVNSKYVRWRLFLQEFDYEIIHRKGRIHQSVDALSRIPIHSRPPDHE